MYHGTALEPPVVFQSSSVHAFAINSEESPCLLLVKNQPAQHATLCPVSTARTSTVLAVVSWPPDLTSVKLIGFNSNGESVLSKTLNATDGRDVQCGLDNVSAKAFRWVLQLMSCRFSTVESQYLFLHLCAWCTMQRTEHWSRTSVLRSWNTARCNAQLSIHAVLVDFSDISVQQDRTMSHVWIGCDANCWIVWASLTIRTYS